MNIPAVLILAMLASTDAAPAAPTEGWQVQPGPQLVLSEKGVPIYKLDCSGSELVVTNFGVTQLLDLQTNKPVPDNEGSSLPAGAALMALATDNTDSPDLLPASSTRNAGTGWDMTIRLAKSDSVFRSLPKAEFVSLFTTGYTRAVGLSKADKKLVGDFVKSCRGG